MAYEHDMMDIVDLIDEKTGHFWSFRPKRERQIRLKKPYEEKIREREEKERIEREKFELEIGFDSGRCSRVSNPATVTTEVPAPSTNTRGVCNFMY
jgi:hypothetical protein